MAYRAYRRRLTAGVVAASVVGALLGRPLSAQDQAPQASALRAQYRIGLGDELSVTVFRHPELSWPSLLVPPSGQVAFLLIGRLDVAGKTLEELEAELTRAFGAGYVPDPQVVVQLLTLNSMNVFVLGEVTEPGIYPTTQAPDLIAAIAAAGGFTPEARRNRVYLIRRPAGEPLQYQRYDLEADTQARRPEQNPPVQPGDLVIVSTSRLAGMANFFATLGAFIRPVADVALIERIFVSEGR